MLEAENRPASSDEQQVLARWSSWGAIPHVFDEANADWSERREQLRALLTAPEYRAASLTTINAHYTDAAYVEAMWGALQDLGFDGGTVLEPGAGSGTFIGMAPASAQMVGVELDPTTAAIARGLYPHAEVRTESFADSRFPRGHFDAAVGNVPFSDIALFDPQFNAGGHAMHNHFIVKSLALTRPGGLVMVLTSSWTLDATNPAARREMNGMADLVGAVRLPSGAHRRAAGTEALTDLLVFRRRAEGEAKRDVTWETVSARDVDGHRIKVNTYFDAHPDHLLGEIQVGQGMYGDATVTVTPTSPDTPAALRAALSDIVTGARERGEVYTQPSVEAIEARQQRAAVQTALWDGTIVAGERDTFQVAHGGTLQPLPIPKSQAAELRALLRMRDGARSLLDAEDATLDDTTDLDVQRAQLNRDYSSYVAAYGPINRFTLRPTGRYATLTDEVTGAIVLDPATGKPALGEELFARVTPRVLSSFRTDPQSALVRALERFDEETQASAPAALLTQRVVVPRPVKQGAGTPSEAIALSLDDSGTVDLEFVAGLLGVDPREARTMMGDLVFEEPAGAGALIHAPEYLSGDVRTKLELAEKAALDDERFQVNVDALRAVIPDPIGIDQIEARLGSVWISPEIHRDFLRDILRDNTVQVENPLPGTWTVKGQRYGLRATNEWGTTRRPATDIVQAVMEQRRVEVTDEIEGADGGTRRVLNPVETTAAQEKADALQERFSQWVWEDPARASQLGEVYNRRFNSIRLRDYSQAGDYLTLPGLTATLTLRPHQRAAVARMIAEPTVGLFHQVGAGKTLEMIVGASEMRRMGLISKPAVVVPNHMLEQFSREWLQAYPKARVLAASTNDLTGDKRRLFVARAAANEWDAIILTQSAFKKIGLSPDFEQRYIEREVDQLRATLDAAKAEGGLSVKRIERKLLAVSERFKKSLAIDRDLGVSFQDTGIDYLIVDEMHMYKNLSTDSNIRDAAIDGSQQATDLHMKLEYLRERYGDRVVTVATATPLANSITEAYVMQRYLRPDLLQSAGITSFDGWAATFGSQITEMEMGPAGGFRQKTRFARFQNVPEMLRMWHVFADVKTGEDLKLPVPEIARRDSDGKREVETVVLTPTPELEDYIAAIADRAEAVASRTVDAREDNMLLISTDGRKAALDLRLVDENVAQTGPVKLDAVAARILRHWEDSRDLEYRDEVSGATSPVRGALQLVFSDLGTPNDERWDVYTELRAKLIQGGMPVDAVRFIHEAKDDKAKGRLFAAARSGHVAVLIGSTGKMGVGTNVQNRLIAMHHIDCPWRPADLEQRDGRGIRQGNQNAEVSLYRYVVERSFDAYSWQTVGRKATFIAQVMRGRLDTRELEDIGDTALSAAEAKALASGNPLVLEKATADATFQKLRRQETAYHRAQSAVQHTRSSAVQRMESCLRDAELLRVAAGRTTDTSGDAFRMQVGSTEYDSRADAGAAIAIWVRGHEIDVARATGADLLLGRIAGHELHVSFDRDTSHTFRPTTVARLSLGSDVPLSGSRMPVEELYGAGVGLVRAIENKTAGIERTIVKLENDAVECERVITEADTSLGKPFPHAAALREAKTRVAEVTDALAESSKPPAADAAVVARDTVSASYPVGSAVRGSSSPVSDRKAYDRSGSDRDRGPGL